MKKLLFVIFALSLSCCCLKSKTDKWQTVCEMTNDKPTKAIYLVSNIGEEDFVQCRIQNYSQGQWTDLSEWRECEDLESGKTVLKSVESKHVKLRLQIGVHEDIKGWCTIIEQK